MKRYSKKWKGNRTVNIVQYICGMQERRIAVSNNNPNGIKSIMTQQEFCDHMEDDDLLEKYPDPILIQCDDGKKLVCISWVRCQKALRAMEQARKMSRPGYDPEKEVTLKITMDQDIYNQLEIICAECGHTVAGATEEFLRWSVEHPDDVKTWVEKCREDGTLDECRNNPIAKVEWAAPEDIKN